MAHNVQSLQSGIHYTVQTGDTLSKIAQDAYGNSNEWQTIYNAHDKANKDIIGRNPNQIVPGQVIYIPVLTSHQPYTVQSGDSLSKIAQNVYGDGNRWQEIYAVNREVVGENANMLSPGQVLHMP
jgi:nucleoid-associated protein YgaU